MIIDKKLLDSVSVRAKECERLRMNYNFHESWESKAQILLNAMEPGTIIPIGRHMTTAETFVVLRGSLKIMFFDNNKNIIMEKIINPTTGVYGVNIPKGQWHQVEVLEANTIIFESREGPYAPLSEEDRLK